MTATGVAVAGTAVSVSGGIFRWVQWWEEPRGGRYGRVTCPRNGRARQHSGYVLQ
ncbi:MAG: hypothetical protein HC804_08385 [Anaerolineae bacterium]|nr:hypothetical protein [Anaerolineae bacterium]